MMIEKQQFGLQKRTLLHTHRPKNKSFLSFKGPCGSQKAHYMIQKGQNLCWAINDDRKVAIWLILEQKGPFCNLCGPKTAI